MVAMAGEAIERETDLTVRGQADDGQQALAGVVSLKPDIVLTDLQLKSSNGLHLIKDLRTNAPAIPIVATTMFDGWRNERLARAAGAVGFVSKQDGPEKLIATVQEVLKGGKNTTDQTSGKQTRLHDEQQSTNSKNKKGIT